MMVRPDSHLDTGPRKTFRSRVSAKLGLYKKPPTTVTEISAPSSPTNTNAVFSTPPTNGSPSETEAAHPAMAPTSNPHARTLNNLPSEIRLEVCNWLLELNNVPKSFGYTGKIVPGPHDPPPPTPTYTKHGLVLVSKLLSAEYRQAFYERTRFFLRIDASNTFAALPQISQQWWLTMHEVRGVPNFWGVEEGLLRSLRHCTLFVEIGDIASSRESRHSVSQLVRSSISLPEARKVRHEMYTYTSLDDLKKDDAEFDRELLNAVQQIVALMDQLRSIYVVWDMSVSYTSRFLASTNTKWSWDTLGHPLVEQLLRGSGQKCGLRDFRVKVSDKYEDRIRAYHKGEGGKWELANTLEA